jgi:MFS family permease
MSQRTLLYGIVVLSVISAGISGSLFSTYLPVIAAEMSGGTATKQDVSTMGSFAGASFLIGWSVGAFVLGALADRIGRRLALFASICTCSIGVLCTAFVPTLAHLIAMRFLTGAGAGGILLIGSVLISEAWAQGNRARMVSIMMNCFPAGFLVAGVIGGNVQNWHTAYLLGGSTIILAFAVLAFVRESDVWKGSEARHETQHVARERVFDARYRKDLILGVTLFGSMLIGLWAAFTWMPTWVHGMSSVEDAQRNRGMVSIVLGIGSMAGALVGAPLANRIGRRRTVFAGYVACVVLSLATFQLGLTPGPVLFGMIFLLTMAIGVNQGVLSTYIPELFPTLIRGAATGISMNAGRLLTAIGVFFVGVLVHTLNGYDNAISTFAAAYVVGAIALTFARETNGQALPE